jgi:nucleotidyltransferase substrate binding protein (TIGR01987 family)
MSDREIVMAKLSDFESANGRFAEVLAMQPSDLQRDAAIKRFEFTFELSWKTLKAAMDHEGVGFFKSPREVLRQAHIVGYITDAVIWEKMLEARNLTSHAYDEELAHLVYNSFSAYLIATTMLLANLRKTYKA